MFGSKRLKRVDDVTPINSSKKTKKGAFNSKLFPTTDLEQLKLDSSDSSQTRIEKLSYNHFVSGCSSMACILSATEDVITVSLPGGSIGKIEIRELSDYIHMDHSLQLVNTIPVSVNNSSSFTDI